MPAPPAPTSTIAAPLLGSGGATGIRCASVDPHRLGQARARRERERVGAGAVDQLAGELLADAVALQALDDAGAGACMRAGRHHAPLARGPRGAEGCSAGGTNGAGARRLGRLAVAPASGGSGSAGAAAVRRGGSRGGRCSRVGPRERGQMGGLVRAASARRRCGGLARVNGGSDALAGADAPAARGRARARRLRHGGTGAA